MSLTTTILSPVTTAGMLYPALFQFISQVAMPNMVSRQFYQTYSLTNSNSVTFSKQSGSPGAVVDEIAEAAEIPLDTTPYTSTNVVPKKIGQGIIISKETIEDSMLPVQQDQMARKALRIANKVDKDCISTIDTGRSGSTSATGQSLSLDGTEFVLSGSGGPGLGTYDIIDAKTLIENNNYMPDSLLVHPRAKKYLERLPHYSAVSYVGGAGRMTSGLPATPGMFGRIQGLDCFASTNCGTGSAYVIARGTSPNILSQFSPLGYFVERRPLTTEVKPLPERDSLGIYITMRYGVTVINGSAAYEIDSINVT